ncbi:DUF5018 domain-containing protein [Bacteroidales bacterium OttesenSCG-928-I14]|nr:DUF5018 domain-containing protein [Bacteroidales bacterium OttesenSCG-928-I14]
MKRLTLLLVTFFTLCFASVGQISTFPFIEGFEDDSPTRDDWTIICIPESQSSCRWSFLNGTNTTMTTVKSAHEGEKNAIFYQSYSGQGQYKSKLISPVMDISGLTEPTISFYYSQQKSGSKLSKMKLYYRNIIDEDDNTGWIEIGNYATEAKEWTYVSLELPNPSATYQIAFEGINAYAYATVVDFVTIEGSSSCIAPSGLAVSNIEARTVKLDWQQVGEISNWKIIYGTAGFDPETEGLNIDVTIKPYYISGLTPNTSYDVYVKADCEAAGWSSLSPKATFTTLESCIVPKSLTTTGVVTHRSAAFTWTQGASETEWIFAYGENGFNPETGGTKITTTDTAYKITGLSPATNYQAYVRAKCEDDETSRWTEPVSFRTADAGLTSFPFVEGFNNTAMPARWTQTIVEESVIYGLTNWEFINKTRSGFDPETFLAPLEGSHFAFFKIDREGKKGNVTQLITPMLDLTALSNPMLDFSYANPRWGSNTDIFKVYYKSNMEGEWVQLGETYDTENISWVDMTFALPEKSDSYFIAFEGIGDNGYGVALDGVVVREMLTENDILTFSLEEERTPAVINNESHTIHVEVYRETDRTSLKPTITVSPHATISPESGKPVNFSSPVKYVVAAENGDKQEWTVTVVETTAPSDRNDIEDFYFFGLNGITINKDLHTVSLKAQWYTDLKNITPEITISQWATISPESGVVQDFSSPVVYTVTAENGEVQDWTVTVSKDATPIPGADCSNPIVVDLESVSFPYVMRGQTSYGLRNIYGWSPNSCSGPFSMGFFEGEEAVYRLDVSEKTSVEITMTTDKTFTGLFLMDDCPDVGECVAFSTKGVGNTQSMVANLYPGSYFLLVECTTLEGTYIPSFDLKFDIVCPMPSDVKATNINPNEAAIEWTANGVETSWKMKVSSLSINPDSEIGDIFDGTVNDTPYHKLSTLSPATKYYVYVQANCSSEWVEEYSFTTVDACPVPTDLASDPYDLFTYISWNDYEATKWNVILSETPVSNPATATVTYAGVSSNPLKIEGLTADTKYYFYVQSVCDGTTSKWSAEGQLKTLCNIQELPIFEGFNPPALTGCLDFQYVKGNGDPMLVTSTIVLPPFEGAGMLEWNSSIIPNNYQTRVVMNPFSTEGVNSVDVDFAWYHKPGGGPNNGKTEGVQVQYSLDGVNWTNVGEKVLRYGEKEGWLPKNFILPEEVTEQDRVFVGFLFTSNNVIACYMDAVSITVSPSCRKVLDFQIDDVETTEVSLSWQVPYPAPANGYDIYYSTSQASPSDETLPSLHVEAGITQTTIENLQHSTSYYLWIRSNCGDGDYSEWSSSYKTFTTLCGTVNLPLAEGFNVPAQKTMPTCWQQEMLTGNNEILFQTASTNPVASPYEGSRMVYFNSAYKLSAGCTTRLISLPISTVGYYDFSIDFAWFHSNSYDTEEYMTEGVQVQYSYDAVNWVNIGDFIPRYNPREAWDVKSILSISEIENKELIYIAFLFRSEAGANCYLDDFQIKAQADANDIKSFSFDEQASPAVISKAKATVDIELVAGTDRSNLVPQIEISNQATIDPGIGVARNFSSPVKYTVKSQSGLERVWTINVSVQCPIVTCPEDMTVAPNSITELTGGLPQGGEYMGEGVVDGKFDATGLSAGTYTITYAYSDINCDEECQFYITVESVDIKDIDSDETNIYPNPNSGHFELDLKNLNEAVNCKIYNYNGSMVHQEIIPAETQTKTFALSLQPGIYMMKLVSDNHSYTKKLIIK